MPLYEFRPVDCDVPPFDLFAEDAKAVLQITCEIGCPETDIYCDGDYAFSLRLHGRARFWTVFQRAPVEDVSSLAPRRSLAAPK